MNTQALLRARTPRGGNGTLIDAAMEQLRADIITGTLPPASRLRIDDLKERYGVGGSPLREALSRLVPEGLVRAESQKGFCVAGMSAEDLADLTRLRQMTEPEALALAMRNGDEVWESEIVAAFHRLARRAEDDSGSVERTERWEGAHKVFHRALIAACGSPRLLQLQGNLYDQARRYRVLLLNYTVADEVIAEHRLLMEAVLSGDVSRASEALRHHLALTADCVYGGNKP